MRLDEANSVKSKANIMVLKAENQEETRLDWLKWVVALVLLLAGLVGNYYYSEVSMPLRMLGWLAISRCCWFCCVKNPKR